MKIDEQQWQKIAAALMAVVSTTLVTGTTVLHWQIGTEGQTALVNEASVILTLLGVILYGANSTTKAALVGYVAGAWRMGKREASGHLVEGAPHRVGAMRGVAPTPEQVRRFVETQPPDA